MVDDADLLAVEEAVGDGDADGWYRAFSALGGRARERAERAVSRGSTHRAREQYLRASEYYRAALAYCRDDLDAPQLRAAYAAHEACFQAAIPLLPHRIEATTIATDDGELTGYFAPGYAEYTPAPCLIVAGGEDTTAAELYPWLEAAVRYGFSALVFDGPGQGGTLLNGHITMRPDWEQVIPGILDAVGNRSDVDADRLALLGHDLGAVWMLRAAVHDQRVAALILSPGWLDYSGVLTDAGLEPTRRARLPTRTAYRRARLAAFDVSDEQELAEAARHYRIPNETDIGRVACPTLVAANPVDPSQAKRVYDALPEPKTWLRTQRGTAASDSREIYFDWLGTTLNQPYRLRYRRPQGG